ncbi:MAG TPA: SIMPL domain-containing protein [Caulobacteraceae bacterium]|jgi:hypothetical protein
MKSPLLAAAGSALALALAVPPVAAQTAPASAADAMFTATTLSISAFGEVKADPDQATITLGVQTDAPTAAEAMRLNAERMSRIVAALRRSGIAEKDIQTSNLSLSAQYQYEERQPPRLTGYQASNQVTVTVNDLDRLGRTIDATVSAGANQIQGIGFGLRNPEAAMDQARMLAVRSLQAKAQLYATASGHRIGRLVNLSESGGYAPVPPPRPMYRMDMAVAASVPETAVAPGQLTVRADVSGLYELTR